MIHHQLHLFFYFGRLNLQYYVHVLLCYVCEGFNNKKKEEKDA